MRRIEIRLWNGRLRRPDTVPIIRRKIAGAIKSGHTVLIDFEDTREFTPDLIVQIIDGWDDSTVKIATCGKNR